jgi:two-component system LytT family sensor kinase
MALAACFPQFPVSKVHLSFWRRLDYSLADEFFTNTAIFWAAFAVVRGMGHYRQLRERERAMSELAVELAEARMMALRMQINPHFLFNTMNAISSLMYTDVRAADRMMEQLSNMLRVTLERGSQQMVRLREEMEFIEMYLALQDIRSSDRVQQQISVDPHLYDAMVPAMLLQPLVENAYVHGLSKISNRGLIEITARPENDSIRVAVRNRGVGLHAPGRQESGRSAIGLNNVRSRLRLHFGEQGKLELREIAADMVEAVVTFPICFTVSSEYVMPAQAESKVLYQI